MSFFLAVFGFVLIVGEVKAQTIYNECAQGYHLCDSGYPGEHSNCVPRGTACPDGSGGGGGGGGGGSSTTYKCTCTNAYGACGSYLGHDNIKVRTCTQSPTGTSTCYLVNGTYYNYTSCPASGITPGTCPTYSGCSADHPGYRYSYSPSCTTCSLGCENHWPDWPSDYTCSAACGGTCNTPTPGGPTPTSGGPTPTPPANCSYRWFCMKTTGKCESTNRSYYNSTTGGVTLNGQCGGGPTCEQNLPNYHESLTGGSCYTSKAACQSTCKIDCPKLAQGDADCDGAVTFKDYFYYVSRKAKANIRDAINVDFNTDGKIDNKDRDIVVKTLKP